MLANTPIDLSAILPKSNNNLIDLQAIEHFSRMMAAGKRFEQKEVIGIMDECCGGSATEGRWHWKRAYDLIEGAFAHFLMENRDFSDFDSLQGFVPHQTARSQKSVEMQQFSTPLAIANIVAVAAQLNLADTVLEPSAGTGILASFAARVTPRLFLNELDSDRAGILKYLFPGLPIHSYNAESIDDYLELATFHRPSVVIMNPPFSSSPNMAKRNRQAVFNHIRSALDRLADFGRLVAIVPHWFNPETCPAFKQYGAQLRLSAFIPGKVYRYHATTMETRLIVLDKIENAGPIGSINVPFEELLAIVQGLPPRQIMPANHLASPTKLADKEEIAQLFLVPPVERQVVRAKSLVAMPLAGFQDAILLIYEAAVPTSSQASDAEGIYESYRSSVVHIPGAIEHPTPLVESLAMASVQTSDQWANLRLDFTPKEAIVDYLMGSFPVQLQEVYTDPEGREYSQLVTDGVGNPIMCKAAVAMRDALVEDIALLPSVAGFLDQLVWHFGSEVVAEVTGRSKRVILEDGKYRLESRPSNANIAETQSFQDDRKRILVFSAAGGTGRSYHADRNVANQRLRRHYLVQSGWEASNAVQSLGRSHRSNQTQPPTFILTTTNQ
jgi:predicted RNA methylase